MIKKVTCYTAICDNCGVNLLKETEFSGLEKDYLAEELNDNLWITKGKKHYCWDCYDYDDNGKLVINKERAKK